MTDPITTVSLCSGVALCAGVLARGALAAATRRREEHERELRQQTELEQFAGRVSATRLRTRVKNPLRRAWQGARVFRTAAIIDECDDVRSFYLTPQDDRPLARYQPGQYLTLELPQPGAPRPLVRCYSLSDRPHDEHYRITVKRARPDGRGSGYFFDQVSVGTELHVRAPAGEFFLEPATREPVALVAGGVGITPVLAMLNAILHDQPGREVVFFAGMRNSREHPFRRVLKQAAAENPALRLSVCYSNPLPTDVLHSDYQHHGRLTPERVRAVLPASNYTFYVCGSGPLMEQMIPGLEEWGVPPEKIHYEAFGPSSIRRGAPESVAPTLTTPMVGQTIRLAKSQKEVVRRNAGESILEAAEQAGVRLNAGCRAGSCGECAVKLLAGKVKTLKRPGVQVAEGECLTCISAPDGPVELDA